MVVVVVVEDEFNRIKRRHSTSWMTAAQHLVAVLWILSAMGPVLSNALVRVLCCACVCLCTEVYKAKIQAKTGGAGCGTAVSGHTQDWMLMVVASWGGLNREFGRRR